MTKAPKDARIEIRLTGEQRELIGRYAEAAGESVSAYLLRKALDGNVPPEREKYLKMAKYCLEQIKRLSE